MGVMPKETVPDYDGRATVSVGWTAEVEMQVATLHGDQAAFVEWCRSVVADADAGQPMVLQPGIFWTPKRHQVNQLINNLRRARDQVWGADA